MPIQESIAVFADVHGNALALSAVLADIATSGAVTVVNLGDNTNGPLEPARCLQLLRASGAIHLRGNGDRMVGLGGDGLPSSVQFARERLDENSLAWLRALPATAKGEGWLAFHGSPKSDVEYLLEEVTALGVGLRAETEVRARLADWEASLYLCGHTHLPRLVSLRGGAMVLNPGSVGLAAYDDVVPFPHKMETGSPHARYALAHRVDRSWQVEFRCVPYDWEAAASQADSAGWLDWARTLRTGYV